MSKLAAERESRRSLSGRSRYSGNSALELEVPKKPQDSPRVYLRSETSAWEPNLIFQNLPL